MCPLTRYPKPQIPSQPHPGAASPKRPHQLSPTHLALLHSCSDHHARARNSPTHPPASRTTSISPLQVHSHTYAPYPSTPFEDIKLPAKQLDYFLRSNKSSIDQSCDTVRCQRKASNTHPRYSLKIEKAYHKLRLSTSYSGPPTMPMSVALGKQGNRGTSYTTYLKPVVNAEWV